MNKMVKLYDILWRRGKNKTKDERIENVNFWGNSGTGFQVRDKDKKTLITAHPNTYLEISKKYALPGEIEKDWYINYTEMKGFGITESEGNLELLLNFERDGAKRTLKVGKVASQDLDNVKRYVMIINSLYGIK